MQGLAHDLKVACSSASRYPGGSVIPFYRKRETEKLEVMNQIQQQLLN